MKKRKEVSATDLLTDDNAWVDLLLSKTALILATVIILTAVYSFAGTSSDLVRKNELEVIATDIAACINTVGTSRPDTPSGYMIYSPEKYEPELGGKGELNISVSVEYVLCTISTINEKGESISAARQLNYRTLPVGPEKLHNLLTGEFAANGNVSQPINSAFPHTDVTDFLDNMGTDELYLNISKELHIQKTSVSVTDGNEVNRLEYVLVYQ